MLNQQVLITFVAFSEVIVDTTIDSSTLPLRVSLEHSGVYLCEVCNAVACQNKSLTVEVEGE